MKIVLSNLSIPGLSINKSHVQIQFQHDITPAKSDTEEKEKIKGVPKAKTEARKPANKATIVLFDENKEELAKQLSTEKKYKITIEEE